MSISASVVVVEDQHGRDDRRSHHEHDTVEISSCKERKQQDQFDDSLKFK